MTASDLWPFLGGNDIGTVTYASLGLCSVLSDFPLLFFLSGPFLGTLQAPCGGDVSLVCFIVQDSGTESSRGGTPVMRRPFALFLDRWGQMGVPIQAQFGDNQVERFSV